MLRFVVRRLLQLIPILFGLSILLFAWLRRLPGGPATALLGERATPERIAAINRAVRARPADLGPVRQLPRADRPVRLRRLDPDRAAGHRGAAHAFPGTIELTIAALIIAVGLGIPLGYLAARRRGGSLDSLSRRSAR